MTTYVPAKKGAEYIFYMGLVSQSTGQFQASATLAAGDFKVSIDGGALANLATLPAVTPAASKMVKVTLSTSEMNGDNITVIGSDAAGAEWDDVIINIQTSARQIDDLATPTNITAGTITTVTNLTNAPTSGDLTATMKASVNAEVDTALSDYGALKPTVAGRTLDVTAAGEAGVDWANIGSPTTTVNLSGTTVKTATDVETDTADIQSRLPAALTADGLIKADTLRVGGTLQTAGDIIGDTNDIQSRLPAALSGDGFIKADLKSIEDELTSGNNATLKLKQLDIANSAGHALMARSTGGNGSGALFQGGNTGGNGMMIQGASGGSGLYVSDSGVAGGHAIQVYAGGGNSALDIISDVGNGISIASELDGIYIESFGTGNGINSTSAVGKSINAPQDIALPSGDLDDQLQAIDNFIDTEVAAIKAKTDQLTFTNANQVDANIQAVNDTNLTGNGSSTPWGPV